MKKQRVLLCGGTGYLGQYIATTLLEKEYPTRIIVRDTAKVTFDTEKFEVLTANVTDTNSLKGSCNEIDTVISTVGITKQKDGFTYMDVDYRANLNLLNEAKKSGVKKFIYVSAFNADKLTHLKMCAAKEKFVSELKNSKMDYCIIRPNGFFSDMIEFIKMANKGKATLFGDGNFKMNPIHGKDLAMVCIDAIHSKEKNIEVGGPEIYTHNEIARMAFSTMNKKNRISYMPEGVRKLILWIARTFTSSKTYGPLEFFFTVLSMDMVAPKYGQHTLSEYFKSNQANYK